ncbi:MAG: electron transfer flavoprotein subunit beta/FixA family protein [Anaerolineae bacterium]|nr:electron transfer flavoprotein subunit beta/FixA family protein [Anaerolineae bacterium]
MKIIVLIKQVLDPAGILVRRDKEKMFINREEYILGPDSKAALEAALRLKDAAGAEVIALSMGKPRAEDALREALAMGCDAVYLVSDEALDAADIPVTASVLAAAIQKLGGADLIVAGRESGDTSAGQIGSRVAEALNYAQVTDVYSLTGEPGAIQATRRWGSGYAVVQAALPAVVTVAPEAFPARYAHGARIMNAYREWQVTTWNAADLGLDEAALKPLLTFRGESFPPPLPAGEQIKGTPASVAHELITALKLQKVIG